MIKSETINFGDHLRVFTDKKTKAQTVAIPITLMSGYNAIISITRLSISNGEWKPNKDIKSLTINYNTDEDNTIK